MERIVLDAEQWDEFDRLLNEPPKFNPRLAALLNRPTILDDSNIKADRLA